MQSVEYRKHPGSNNEWNRGRKSVARNVKCYSRKCRGCTGWMKHKSRDNEWFIMNVRNSGNKNLARMKWMYTEIERDRCCRGY